LEFLTVGTTEQLKDFSAKNHSPGMIFHVYPKGVSFTDVTNKPSANGHWESLLNHNQCKNPKLRFHPIIFHNPKPKKILDRILYAMHVLDYFI